MTIAPRPTRVNDSTTGATRSGRRSGRSEKKRRNGRSEFRNHGSLESYFSRIGRRPPLSSAQEYSLAVRIREGDESALRKLVIHNLRFVAAVAMQYQNQGMTVDDLIAEGNIGLLKAAKRFDERKSFRFVTYAVWWIRRAILESLAAGSRIVRVPPFRVSTLLKVAATRDRLEQRLRRPPTALEVSHESGVGLKYVELADRLSLTHVSLDAPLDAESDDLLRRECIEDTESDPPDTGVEHDSLRDALHRNISQLSHRQQQVLQLHFGLNECRPCTLKEIGQRLGITRERARQIRESALERLRAQCGPELHSALAD